MSIRVYAVAVFGGKSEMWKLTRGNGTTHHEIVIRICGNIESRWILYTSGEVI